MISKKIYSILGILIVLSIFVFSQEFDELKLKQPDKAADLLLQEETLNLEKAEELLSQKETKEVKALSQEKRKELGERYFSERLGLSKEQSFDINKEAEFELTEVDGKKILRTESIEVEINKLKSLSSNPNIEGFEITKQGLLEIKQKKANPFKISDLGSMGVSEDGKTVFFHAKEKAKVKVDFGDGVPIEGKIVSFTRIAAGIRVVVTSAADFIGEFKIKSGDEMFTIQPTSPRKPKAPKVLVDSQVIVEKDTQERVSKIYTLQDPDGFKGITSEGLKFSSETGSLAFDYYKDGFSFNLDGEGGIEYFGFKGDSSTDGKIEGKYVGEDLIIKTENTKVSYDWTDAEGESHKYDAKDDEGKYFYVVSPNIDKYKDLAVNGLVIDVDDPNKAFSLGDLHYVRDEAESYTRADKGKRTETVIIDEEINIVTESTESLWRDPDGFYLQTNGKGEFYITTNILREIVRPETIGRVYEIGPEERSLFLRRTSEGYEIHDPREPFHRTLISREKVDFTNEDQYRKFMEKLIKPRW